MAILDFIVDLLTRFFPRLMNQIKIDFIVSRERKRRPHPFSLWTDSSIGPPTDGLPTYCDPVPVGTLFVAGDYVSWPGLFDRSFTGRHLPPSEEPVMDLPTPEEIVSTLFLRDGAARPCKKTSALFCFFAQWFTDSFLRTHPCDRRRHTGNNEIDFCQLYGLDEGTTRALRMGSNGLLKARTTPNGAMLPYLVLQKDHRANGHDVGEIDPDFSGLSYIGAKPPIGKFFKERLCDSFKPAVEDPNRWLNMYATGLDRGNSTIFYTALSTMCLREHNRVAMELSRIHPEWNDDRLFETARLINIHNVLEIVIEDYINHVAGARTFKLDSNFAEQRPWYRTNRISLEFNLLYRWHALVPDHVVIDGRELSAQDYRFNNGLVEQISPETLINQASLCPAGRVGLFNTPKFLERAEISSIRMGREFRLQSFNAYCKRFRQRPYESIEALVGDDKKAAALLNSLYKGDVNRVEFVVGLSAEKRSVSDPDAALPPLLRKMVAVDAFTHILTNPVLSRQAHEVVFTPEIMPFIQNTGGVSGLMQRNFRKGVAAAPSFSVA